MYTKKQKVQCKFGASVLIRKMLDSDKYVSLKIGKGGCIHGLDI